MHIVSVGACCDDSTTGCRIDEIQVRGRKQCVLNLTSIPASTLHSHSTVGNTLRGVKVTKVFTDTAFDGEVVAVDVESKRKRKERIVLYRVKFSVRKRKPSPRDTQPASLSLTHSETWSLNHLLPYPSRYAPPLPHQDGDEMDMYEEEVVAAAAAYKKEPAAKFNKRPLSERKPANTGLLRLSVLAKMIFGLNNINPS